jgi:carboxymethylenebutenolidase
MCSVYDVKLLSAISTSISDDPRLVCLVGYGPTSSPTAPTLLHLSSGDTPDHSSTTITHTYPDSSPYFVLPQAAEYSPGSAGLAHTRSLVFLRENLGGPIFDLEAIWNEHCFFEFEDRSVAKTMGTMVVRSLCRLLLTYP